MLRRLDGTAASCLRRHCDVSHSCVLIGCHSKLRLADARLFGAMKLNLKLGKATKAAEIEQLNPVFEDVGRNVAASEGFVLSTIVFILKGKRFRLSSASEAQTRLVDAGTRTHLLFIVAVYPLVQVMSTGLLESNYKTHSVMCTSKGRCFLATENMDCNIYRNSIRSELPQCSDYVHTLCLQCASSVFSLLLWGHFMFSLHKAES